MGFLSSLLSSFIGDSGGSGVGSGILSMGLSAMNAGLDSLGLSQHGRDQYFARDLQRELLWDQINAQIAENQKNRDFSKEFFNMQWDKMLQNYPDLLKMSSDAQFNLWRQQFNMQNEYNSPQAQVGRMMSAGLNPAGGTSTVAQSQMSPSSVGAPPSISGSPLGGSVSPIGIPQGLSGRGTQLSEIGSFIRDMSQAAKNTKETSWYDKFMQVNLDNLQSQTARNEILKSYEEIQKNILECFGHKKAAQEYLNLVQQGANLATEGKLMEAKEALAKAQETLANSENDKIQRELPYLNERFQKINDNLDSEIALNKEKQKTEQSAQAVNYSESSYKSALAKTEDDLRSGRVEGQSLANDLATIDKYLQGNELKVSDATWQYRVVEIAESAVQAGLITKQEYEKLHQLKIRTDWAGRQEFADYCCKFINAFSGVMQSFASVKNSLNGEQRNNIRQQVADQMKEHDNMVHENVITTGLDNRGHKVSHSVTRYRAPWQK